MRKLKAKDVATHLNELLKRDKAGIAALVRAQARVKVGVVVDTVQLPVVVQEGRAPVCALDLVNCLCEGDVEAVFEKGSGSRIVEFRVRALEGETTPEPALST